MANSKVKTAGRLSTMVFILASAQSLGGLLLEDPYRDNGLVTAGWFGNDLVTLFVTVPVLAVSQVAARRGSLPARLVWLGALDYMLYNYAFYLFGAAFNAFFLAYASIFALAILALVFGLVETEVGALAQRTQPSPADRWIAAFMLLIAAGLTTVYLAQSLSFIATGNLPQIVIRSGHPTSVVFGLDLSLVVPYFTLGALWLWQRRPWGYLVATVMNVKGALYMLALSATTSSAFLAGFLGDLAELAIWLPIGAGCLLASTLLLRGLATEQAASSQLG